MLKMLILFSIFLSGCSLNGIVPRNSKDALRYASEVKEENLVFNSNYQAIAKCWDEKAEKPSIDFSNATYLNIYSDLGIAEITVKTTDGYFIFVEVLKVSDEQSKVNAYGLGQMSKTFIPNWLSIMGACSRA
ncbi:hypothetical protein [Rheinheimera soli]|uniref:hypothetical protein n=1 Tax=Rheinheimera soli TaxID=443616 RepID=UPI001E3E3F94|nr:hypothetical protein [Rheinheimera soli]